MGGGNEEGKRNTGEETKEREGMDRNEDVSAEEKKAKGNRREGERESEKEWWR